MLLKNLPSLETVQNNKGRGDEEIKTLLLSASIFRQQIHDE